VSEVSCRAAWLRQARSYLWRADPVLARLFDDRPDFDPLAWLPELPPTGLYGAVLFQVTGLQLSAPPTRRTLARLQALFGGHFPAPAELLGVDPGQLREAGLSWLKISTLRDRAGRITDGRLNRRAEHPARRRARSRARRHSPDRPVDRAGRTLLALLREDVVLPGDLALREAVQAVYHLGRLRSLATSYLLSAAFEQLGTAGRPASDGLT
jgi:3-methyladenine DNA glycosylase/8-oxoguanine DNA glycosylase